MANKAGREPARDPQDLEQLLVSRERTGDLEGMMALYEPQAVLDCGDGQLVLGKEAIRAFYAGVVAAGRKFDCGINVRRACGGCQRGPGAYFNSASRWQRDC